MLMIQDCSHHLRVGLMKRVPTVCYQRGFSSSRVAMRVSRGNTDNVGSEWGYPIFASDRVKDRKSVFLVHASTLPTPSALNNLIGHLTSLPVLKKVTHCMYAYRVVSDPSNPSIKFVGQHDGGESGSSERLSRLLEAKECENVVVVASRWYDGVKLGSDRWNLISTVAKEALFRGNFIMEKNTHSKEESVKPGINKKQK